MSSVVHPSILPPQWTSQRQIRPCHSWIQIPHASLLATEWSLSSSRGRPACSWPAFPESSPAAPCTAYGEAWLLSALQSTRLFHIFVSEHSFSLSLWNPLLPSLIAGGIGHIYLSFKTSLHIPLSSRLLRYPQAKFYILFCIPAPHSLYRLPW